VERQELVGLGAIRVARRENRRALGGLASERHWFHAVAAGFDFDPRSAARGSLELRRGPRNVTPVRLGFDQHELAVAGVRAALDDQL